MQAQRRATRLGGFGGMLVAGFAAFPLAAAVAADPGAADGPSEKGRAAILRGRVTGEAGAPLAGVRVRAAIPATDMRFVDMRRDLVDGPDVSHRLMETRTDANGAYRLEIPGITGPTKVSLDAMTPGYRRLVGTLMSGGDPNEFEVKPGAETEAPLKLRPSLYFRGTVVDEQGKPISGASVSANVALGGGTGGIERTVTNPDGSFELFCYPEKRPGNVPGLGRGVVFFSHPDYIDNQIEDIYALAPKDRKSLRVALRTGYKVTGMVLGRTGKPVARATVKVARNNLGHEKATVTDASGKFVLRGLREGPSVLKARSLEFKQKAEVPITLDGDRGDMIVRLKPIVVPGGIKTYSALGMKLADVTPELKAAYDLWNDRGAFVVDPGPNPGRLKIGEVVEGDVFWMVGDRRIGSVREFVDRLLAEPGVPIAGGLGIRVVYSFVRADGEGTNTQYIRFTEDERERLKELAAQLAADSH